MKVLALSFGRKMKNCDILAKEALMGAEIAGAKVKFVNMLDRKISHCTGCGACDKRRERGGPSRCIIKDDFPAIEELIIEADCIIVAAPVYVLGPVGQFKNLVDRMGPSHDMSVLQEENEKRRKEGKTEDELLDKRLFKHRYVGLISVGGATTEHWTSLGLPTMHLMTFSMQMTVVDQYNAYRMGERVHPCFDQELLARMNKMGQNVVSAYGKEAEEIKWMGEKEGICPHCHNDLLTIKGNTIVECPVCGMEGVLSIEKGEIKAVFSEKEKLRSRLRIGGIREHKEELKHIMGIVHEKLGKDGQKLPDLVSKYIGYGEVMLEDVEIRNGEQ